MFAFLSADDLRSEEIFLRLAGVSEAQPEKGIVPAYAFDICLPGGAAIGGCSLRVGHNARTYIAGNIGYHIDEPYRGHRYALKACGLLFELARRHGMDRLIITCAPDNAASARTCELAGGQFVELAPVPEDDELYAQGKRHVRVYRFDL